MPITLTRVANSRQVSGHRRQVELDFVCDNSYPTGGYTITPAMCGLKRITKAVVIENPDGYDFHYDRATSKLLVRYFDYNNAADGPIIEVPNTTNIATVNGRLEVEGY